MAVRVRQRRLGGNGPGKAQRASRIVDTIAAVAEFAGVTVPSASAWFDRGAPVLPDGRYDLWAIARWHGENVGTRNGGGAGAEDTDATADVAAATATTVAGERDRDLGDDAPDGSRADWELRRVRAAALNAELKLREARREVISVVEHHDVLFGLVDSFVSALENMPRKVTPLLLVARGYQEVTTVLEDHIRAMRIQLVARYSPKQPTSESSGESAAGNRASTRSNGSTGADDSTGSDGSKGSDRGAP